MTEKSSIHFDQQRLRWQCRRGMLELDILLLNFLDEQYLNLTATERQQFETLLQEQDPTLYSWFFLSKTPADPEVAQLVAKIVK